MMDVSEPKFMAIVGPTASGKSALAMRLAHEYGGEIICCDSVQLYRGFDIGSAKPSLEDQALIPHHLVSILNPEDNCDAARYADLARSAISDVTARGRLPIVVGGTGLYLRALMGDRFQGDLSSDPDLRLRLQSRTREDLYAELEKLDPRRAKELHPNDKVRVLRALEINILSGKPVQKMKSQGVLRQPVIFLTPPRDVLHERIARRTKSMLSEGLIEEVQKLLGSGIDRNVKPFSTIGYRQVLDYLDGKIANLEEQIIFATRQYAKRQCTWFRSLKTPYEITFADKNDFEFEEIINSIK